MRLPVYFIAVLNESMLLMRGSTVLAE